MLEDNAWKSKTVHHCLYSFKLSKVICIRIWKLCLPKNMNLKKTRYAMLPIDCDSSRTLYDLNVVCKSNHTKSSKYYKKCSINWLSSRIMHQQFAGYNFIRIMHQQFASYNFIGIIHSIKNVLSMIIVLTLPSKWILKKSCLANQFKGVDTIQLCICLSSHL